MSARISLVNCLIVGASVELLLNRIARPMLETAQASPAVEGFVRIGGTLAFYFSGLLALAIVVWAALALLRKDAPFSTPERLALLVVGAPLVPLAAIGHVADLPALLAPHLNISFGLSIATVTLLLALRPVSLRAKLGLSAFALPLLLHAYWLATVQLPVLAPAGEHADLPRRLFHLGEALTVLAAFAPTLCFSARLRPSRALRALPLGAALCATGFLYALLKVDFFLAERLTRYGWGIALPLPRGPQALQLALVWIALFALVFGIAALWQERGPGRALASGLLLVVLAGYHLHLPYHFALTLVGVWQIAVAVLARKPEGAETPPTAST